MQYRGQACATGVTCGLQCMGIMINVSDFEDVSVVEIVTL